MIFLLLQLPVDRKWALCDYLSVYMCVCVYVEGIEYCFVYLNEHASEE